MNSPLISPLPSVPIPRILETLKTPHTIMSSAFSPPELCNLSNNLFPNILREGGYDDSTDTTKKKQVFEILQQTIKNWISLLAKRQNVEPSGGLHVFGSFRMQVNQKESDLDTVCIVPKYITRDEDFFNTLFNTLKESEKVTDLYPIIDAQVPLIKLKHSSIPVDILFARLEITVIPEPLDFLNDNKLLSMIDEQSYKSFNGIRTADLILNSIKNKEEFRVFLKLVKLWAKRKLVYSSMLGYLGGISWAIMTAKIAQMYPNYCAAQLLERFFFIFSHWNFGEMPITIEKVRREVEEGMLRFLSFQWEGGVEQMSEFNIITPAFPCMNSAHSVTSTTGEIIRRRLREGWRMIRSGGTIEGGGVGGGIGGEGGVGGKEGGGSGELDEGYKGLFVHFDFFGRFGRFLEISILSKENLKDFVMWKGHYESKLRKLTRIIETSPANHLVSLVFNPLCYETDEKKTSRKKEEGGERKDESGRRKDEGSKREEGEQKEEGVERKKGEGGGEKKEESGRRKEEGSKSEEGGKKEEGGERKEEGGEGGRRVEEGRREEEGEEEEFAQCVKYYVGIRIGRRNVNYGNIMNVKEVDLTGYLREFLNYVENRWIIPEHLTTRIRIVERNELNLERRERKVEEKGGDRKEGAKRREEGVGGREGASGGGGRGGEGGGGNELEKEKGGNSEKGIGAVKSGEIGGGGEEGGVIKEGGSEKKKKKIVLNNMV